MDIEETIQHEPQEPPEQPDDLVDGGEASLYDRLRNNRFFWQGRFLPAFWTITGVLSLTVNIILIVILLILGRELFVLKDVVGNQLLYGLQTNFQAMDTAVISTTVTVKDTIQVNDTIPVQFTLPLEQETVVTLTEDTDLQDVPVEIIIPGLSIDAPANITLPKDTPLPVFLNIDVPVDQTIPISITVPVLLKVPVSIPLDQTELHVPFVGLQGVVAPYNNLLADAPGSWEEVACQAGRLLCLLFGDN